MYKEDGTNNNYLPDSSTGDSVKFRKASSDSGENITESDDVEQASFSHTEDSSLDKFTKMFTDVNRGNNTINKHFKSSGKQNITTSMQLVDSGNINNSSYNHTQGIGFENGGPEHTATVVNQTTSDSKKKGEEQCYLRLYL